MSLRQLLRKPRTSFNLRFNSYPSRPPRRQESSTPPSKPSTQDRANRVLDRVPRFLRKYTDGLKNAPITHIVSFLILHEITAVVPIIALATFFHYTKWLPPYISEGKYISDGIEKFGNYFRRKGWFGFHKEEGNSKRVKLWNFSESGSRVVVEVATAYAITKALLPLRIIFSVWLAPWFARVVVGRVSGGMGRVFAQRKPMASTSPAAGTGATGTGGSTIVKGAEKSGKV